MVLLLHNSTSSVASSTSTTATTATMALSNYTTSTVATTSLVTPLCHDGTVTCSCANNNNTRGMLSDEGSLDALLYIVVVLLFYAFSIVVLMVKYIRRENKEAYLRQYFDDFVAREHFQSAQARNQVCMKSIMDRQSDLNSQNHNDLGMSRDKMENQDIQLCIPETINELVEDEEEAEFESAEDELHDEIDHTDIDVDGEQVSSLEELLPHRATPV